MAAGQRRLIGDVKKVRGEAVGQNGVVTQHATWGPEKKIWDTISQSGGKYYWIFGQRTCPSCFRKEYSYHIVSVNELRP